MVSIRTLRPDEAQRVFSYASDPENTRYMLELPFSSLREAEDFIARSIAAYGASPPGQFAFAVLCDGVHAGLVFASLSGDAGADIGWIIDRAFWGRGLAPRGAKLLTELLRTEYGIRQVCAYCDGRNLPSRRVAEKLGMRFAGENGMRHYRKAVTPGTELKYELQL